MLINLFKTAKTCLEESRLEHKIHLSKEAAKNAKQDYVIERLSDWAEPKVGRPSKPVLVSPQSLPKRGIGSKQGKYSLLHAIAHIEFNAINLAWDAIYRFQDMPEEYYWDWLKIAGEETNHFMLLRSHLNSGNFEYGDFDAHDGLWDMAKHTANDVLDRMAIIPRVLEARGLDVTPAMIKKFSHIGETEIVLTLETIYEEEISHVFTGNRWFRFLCEQRGLIPEQTFIDLVRKYQLDDFRGGFNKVGRAEAGFSEAEMDYMENMFVKVG